MVLAIIVVCVVVVGGLFGPGLVGLVAKGSAKQRCALIQEQYDAAVAAADTTNAARLARTLAACNEDLEALGVDIDPGEESIKACEQRYLEVETWFTIYRNTDWADPFKRSNNMNNIYNETRNVPLCIREAMPLTRTIRGINAARNLLDRAIRDCYARRSCFDGGGYGCGRYGFIEPDNAGRAAQENALIVELQPMYAVIDARKAALGL